MVFSSFLIVYDVYCSVGSSHKPCSVYFVFFGLGIDVDDSCLSPVDYDACYYCREDDGDE